MAKWYTHKITLSIDLGKLKHGVIGNTTDFGSVILSSSLNASTNHMIKEVVGFLITTNVQPMYSHNNRGS